MVDVLLKVFTVIAIISIGVHLYSMIFSMKRNEERAKQNDKKMEELQKQIDNLQDQINSITAKDPIDDNQ